MMLLLFMFVFIKESKMFFEHEITLHVRLSKKTVKISTLSIYIERETKEKTV